MYFNVYVPFEIFQLTNRFYMALNQHFTNICTCASGGRSKALIEGITIDGSTKPNEA